MAILRFISDIHGHMDHYLKLLDKADYSIQVGDLGFDYIDLHSVDSTRHRVLGGNHDNYSVSQVDGHDMFFKQTEHFLGNFGAIQFPHFPEFFFIRGEHSIDWRNRCAGVDWWPDHEELNYSQMRDCLDLYKSLKPDYVVSHGCPESVIPYVKRVDYWDGELIRPSRTAILLEACLKVHRPRIWVMGHFHVNLDKKINGTRFICMEPGGFVDFSHRSFE